ncbi:MAG: rRNA pseudouridine synthase [Spirochaetaceae bacterium]|nr:rRNA pseudouridine synthase [Spirochaetaceae bacterium]
MKQERLDKILSHHGFGTRKDAKFIILEGRVKVNGRICYIPEYHVTLEMDSISVDEKDLELRQHIYLMMNKPGGVICSNKDGIHKTVFDLLDERLHQEFLGGSLHMIGRLDLDTEGLLLLTTDGSLTHKLTSPKKNIPKTYFIKLENSVPAEMQPIISRRFAEGIHIAPEGDDGEYDCKPSNLNWLSEDTCTLVITEGRYHQVKRMIAAAGNKVAYLKRTVVNKLPLDISLQPGEYRELTAKELSLLN